MTGGDMNIETLRGLWKLLSEFRDELEYIALHYDEDELIRDYNYAIDEILGYVGYFNNATREELERRERAALEV
jgi:hypothetical protein